MGLFDFFKNKKKSKETKVISEDFIEIEDTKEIELCTFTEISGKRFFNELINYGFEPEYWFGTGTTLINSSDKFKMFIGDIEEKGELKFDVENLLVVGNIDTEWLNTENNSGGSLFVTGNIICDYFSNYYGNLVIINGSLLVKKIINNEFEDSTLMVKQNLATEYYHGIDIWAEVGGKIEITYGNGYCLPIGYKESSKECVIPKYSNSISKEFLGINDDNTDNINKLIKERVLG